MKLRDKIKNKVKTTPSSSKKQQANTIQFDESHLAIAFYPSEKPTQLNEIKIEAAWENQSPHVKRPLSFEINWFRKTQFNIQPLEALKNKFSYQLCIQDIGLTFQIQCVPITEGLQYVGMPFMATIGPVILDSQTQEQAQDLYDASKATFFIEYKELSISVLQEDQNSVKEGLVRIVQNQKLELHGKKSLMTGMELLYVQKIDQTYPELILNRQKNSQLNMILNGQGDYVSLEMTNSKIRDTLLWLMKKIRNNSQQSFYGVSEIKEQQVTKRGVFQKIMDGRNNQQQKMEEKPSEPQTVSSSFNEQEVKNQHELIEKPNKGLSKGLGKGLSKLSKLVEQKKQTGLEHINNQSCHIKSQSVDKIDQSANSDKLSEGKGQNVKTQQENQVQQEAQQEDKQLNKVERQLQQQMTPSQSNVETLEEKVQNVQKAVKNDQAHKHSNEEVSQSFNRNRQQQQQKQTDQKVQKVQKVQNQEDKQQEKQQIEYEECPTPVKILIQPVEVQFTKQQHNHMVVEENSRMKRQFKQQVKDKGQQVQNKGQQVQNKGSIIEERQISQDGLQTMDKQQLRIKKSQDIQNVDTLKSKQHKEIPEYQHELNMQMKLNQNKENNTEKLPRHQQKGTKTIQTNGQNKQQSTTTIPYNQQTQYQHQQSQNQQYSQKQQQQQQIPQNKSTRINQNDNLQNNISHKFTKRNLNLSPKVYSCTHINDFSIRGIICDKQCQTDSRQNQQSRRQSKGLQQQLIYYKNEQKILKKQNQTLNQKNKALLSQLETMRQTLKRYNPKHVDTVITTVNQAKDKSKKPQNHTNQEPSIVQKTQDNTIDQQNELSPYQQLMKNFQTVKSQKDQLTCKCQVMAEEKESLEQDLMKYKVELEELQSENKYLQKKCESLNSQLALNNSSLSFSSSINSPTKSPKRQSLQKSQDVLYSSLVLNSVPSSKSMSFSPFDIQLQEVQRNGQDDQYFTQSPSYENQILTLQRQVKELVDQNTSLKGILQVDKKKSSSGKTQLKLQLVELKKLVNRLTEVLTDKDVTIENMKQINKAMNEKLVEEVRQKEALAKQLQS